MRGRLLYLDIDRPDNLALALRDAGRLAGGSRSLPRTGRSRYSLCWGEGDSRQGRSVPYKREWSEGRPDGHASQAGFFARSGRHHAQVAVSMTASDKLSPVVNGAKFDAREDAKGASGWSAIAGPYGLVHFGVIRGKRPSVGSIAAIDTIACARHKADCPRSLDATPGSVRRHSSTSRTWDGRPCADVADSCGSAECGEIAESVWFCNREIICVLGKLLHDWSGKIEILR